MIDGRNAIGLCRPKRNLTTTCMRNLPCFELRLTVGGFSVELSARATVGSSEPPMPDGTPLSVAPLRSQVPVRRTGEGGVGAMRLVISHMKQFKAQTLINAGGVRRIDMSIAGLTGQRFLELLEGLFRQRILRQ